eukprot:g8281.t1
MPNQKKKTIRKKKKVVKKKGRKKRELKIKESYGDFKTGQARNFFTKLRLEFKQRYNINVTLLHLKQSQPSDKRNGLYNAPDIGNFFHMRLHEHNLKLGVVKNIDIQSVLDSIPKSETGRDVMLNLPTALQGIKIYEKPITNSLCSHWLPSHAKDCKKLYVRFPGKIRLLAYFFGGTRTVKQINDHIGKIRRRMIRDGHYDHPYVRLHKGGKTLAHQLNKKKKTGIKSFRDWR